MVPEGWKSEQFGNIVDFKNGLNFTRSDSGESIKVVGVGDFKDHAQLDKTDHLETVTVAGRIRDDVLLSNGDLLFVRSNGNKDLVGRCLYFPRVTDRLAFSGFTIRGRVDKRVIRPDYAAYLARSSLFRQQIKRSGGGTNISNLSQQILSEVSFGLPPLAEQRSIATILMTWDNAIATTKRLLANSEKQKKALMQQLLTGKKRLPGFSGEWKTQQLGELFKRVTRRNDQGNTNVVTISAQQGLIKQDEFFKKSVASETLENYYLIERGQFAYNKSYSNGYPMGAIKRLHRYPKAVVTSLYICFDVKDSKLCSADFFEKWFEAGLLNRGLTKVANEGGRAHGLLNVKPSDFFGLTALTPSIQEQEAIAKVLRLADQEIECLRKRLECLQQEKKALMQQLLTGKRRVKVEAPQKEAVDA